MKVFANVMKVIAALAVIAGTVYVIAAYGDKIVAWVKDLLAKLGWQCDVPVQSDSDDITDTVETPADEAEAEVPTEENTVHADEADFEGQ